MADQSAGIMSLDEARELMTKALSQEELSRADQVEVLFVAQSTALTRFANSSIHQNVADKNVHISFRTVMGTRRGYAASNAISNEALARAAAAAIRNTTLTPPDPDFRSLPQPKPVAAMESYDQATAECSPERRAQEVIKVIEVANGLGLRAAGSYSTSESLIGVANSIGVESLCRQTGATFKTTLSDEDSSGHSGQIAREVLRIDGEAAAQAAGKKALRGQNPVDIEPGQYTVILEPEAVADMVCTLALVGLGAQSYQEKRSFVTGQLGKGLVGSNITLWDDARDPATIGLPFDFEGLPKEKVVLFENGIAKNVVYDSYTANKEGKESTGHALPEPNPYGPLALNLFLAPGESSKEQMISSTKRGILVSRFHYTNIEDPLRTIYTGMTRDGTFLIEDGRIKGGIKNLRFTQSILEALNQVETVSKDRELKEGFFEVGLCYAPTLKIKNFNFTGTTRF